MPQTSTVIILLTAVLIFTFKYIYGAEVQIEIGDGIVEPHYLNAYSYTNLTVRASEVKVLDGALVDFVVKGNGSIYLGLLPQKDVVVIRADNRTLRLPVKPVCRLNMYVVNMSQTISTSVNSTCGAVALYANNTKLPNATHKPKYSGIYVVVATTGVFYNKTRVFVTPNVTIAGAVFGRELEITLDPPPLRGLVRVGSLTLPATERVKVDTWLLGGGNHTMALTVSGLTLVHNFTIARATPKIEISTRGEYTYGELMAVEVKTYVGDRLYSAVVNLHINKSRLATVRTPISTALPQLDAGRYLIEAVALGDRNITSTSAAVWILVKPQPVELELRLNGTYTNPHIVNFGKVIYVDAKPKAALIPVGAVEVYLNGVPHGFVIDTLSLTPGVYNLTAYFKPSKNFAPATASVLIYVVPSAPDISIARKFVSTYGTPLNVTFRVTLFGRPINAVATIEISGRQGVRTNVTNGVGVYTFRDLPAGTYLGHVVVEGVGLIQSRESFTIHVESASVSIDLSTPSRGTYGEVLPISVTISPPVVGLLSIAINSTLIYSAAASRYSGQWSPPRGGVYQVVAKFESRDPNYASVETARYIYIDRAKCVIDYTLEGDTAPGGLVYVLRQYRVKPSTNLPTYVEINGSRTERVVKFNKTGVYNVTVYFPGDDSFYPCAAVRFYTVVKNPTGVHIATNRRVSTLESTIALTVEIDAVGPKEGNLTVYKKNKTVNMTYVETYPLTSALGLKFETPGVYEIVVYYSGNLYQAPNMSNSVVVTVEPSVLGIPTFLLGVYLSSIVIGAVVVTVAKNILKRES